MIYLSHQKGIDMPGPVSDSYDPEWGSSANAEEITNAIQNVYDKLSKILEQQKPLYILDLVRIHGLNKRIDATLTEKEWRILRFTCERAKESI